MLYLRVDSSVSHLLQQGLVGRQHAAAGLADQVTVSSPERSAKCGVAPHVARLAIAQAERHGERFEQREPELGARQRARYIALAGEGRGCGIHRRSVRQSVYKARKDRRRTASMVFNVSGAAAS